MLRARTTLSSRSTAVGLVLGVAVAAGSGVAVASAQAPPSRQAPGGTMTRQLPQDVRVSVRGRSVSVHFGSLRRRATRTATLRFTRTSGGSVVKRVKASGMLRLTAPKGSRKVRVSIPSSREWTATSITRSISSR